MLWVRRPTGAGRRKGYSLVASLEVRTVGINVQGRDLEVEDSGVEAVVGLVVYELIQT